MRIGIVGAGRIGGNCARQLAKGGHEVKLSGRDPSKLEPLAVEIGDAASVGSPAEGETGATFHAARVGGARYTKSFNTLTSAFQAEVAFRPEPDCVVQWVCGDDADAKRAAMGLIAAAG